MAYDVVRALEYACFISPLEEEPDDEVDNLQG